MAKKDKKLLQRYKKFVYKYRLRRIGIILIIISFLLYGILFLVLFTHLQAGIKAVTVSALIVAREVTLWAGILILGKAFVTKYKEQLNPRHWFKFKSRE